MRITRVGAACAAAALTILSATSANADLIVNDLDAAAESMTLQYDTADGIAGPSGSTTLSIIVENKPADDFKGCNIRGGHFVTLEADFDPSVVDVQLSDGGKLDNCADTVVATVTPVATGHTPVTFTGFQDANSNAPFNDFTYSGADFEVTVVDADLGETPGSGTVCDADPAAPAWAAALLKANNVKAKGPSDNYVSSVAQAMGQRAAFPSGADWIDKSSHPAYEQAVWTYMKSSLGLKLPTGPDKAARPGWECTPIS